MATIRDNPNYRKISNRNLGFGNLEIRVLGDLNTLDSFMNMGPEIEQVVREAQSSFADRYYTRLRHYIRTGGAEVGIVENSSLYAAKKRTYITDDKADHAGYMMGNFYRSVQKFRDSGKYGLVSVGIRKNTPRDIIPPSSMISEIYANQVTVDEYVRFLEGGTGRSPARPFFSRTYEKLGGNVGLANFISRSISQRIRVFKK